MKLRLCSVCLFSLGMMACGGAASQPKAADDAKPAPAETEAAPAKSDLAPAALTKEGGSSSPGAGTEAPSPEPAEKRAPRDILLQEEAAFLLDFRRSDVGKKAEERCAKQSGDDPAANAKCMTRALNGQEREGLSFEEDDAGTVWYTKFVVQGGKQRVRSRVKCDIGELESGAFKVTTHGASTVPKELSFSLPDDYTLEYDDPKKGKLVYELRLGLIGDTK